jgi:patatin-like phospholipase/acyl hydrolase
MPKKTNKATNSGKYVILSIDGGGIRGLIPATVLMEVEKMIQAKRGDQRRIGDYFDFIAGTSTGGILTCMFLAPDLARPDCARFSASQARDLYLEHGDAIFDRSIWQIISSGGGLSDEKYDASELERVLKNYVQDITLKDLIRPCLITGYDVRQYRPVFFTQQDAGDGANNFLVRDLARATSAAPTYFEPAFPESLDTIPNATPVIDGGVFANNPTACAYVEALVKGRGIGHGVPPKEIAILSLGTGRKPETITLKQCKDWGLAGWARPLIGILMEGVAQTVHYQMSRVFESLKTPKHYLRVDGEFGDYKNRLAIEGLNPAMDCASKDNMRRLCVFGEQLAQNYRRELQDFVNAHF